MKCTDDPTDRATCPPEGWVAEEPSPLSASVRNARYDTTTVGAPLGIFWYRRVFNADPPAVPCGECRGLGYLVEASDESVECWSCCGSGLSEQESQAETHG